MEKKKYTLATTDILQFEYEDFVESWKDNHNCPEIPSEYSDEFKEWCMENEEDDYDLFVDEWKDEVGYEEVPDDNSRAFWDWCGEERDMNWESDMDEIKYCVEYNVPCVITGNLGLWDGTHEIIPVVENTIYDAIMKCCQDSGSCCDFEIEWEDGVIYVYHHHHDGCNCFEIHPLSKKGLAKKETAERNYEDMSIKPWDIKKIPYLYNII